MAYTVGWGAGQGIEILVYYRELQVARRQAIGVGSQRECLLRYCLQSLAYCLYIIHTKFPKTI